jgi:hypothetical protein
MKKGENMKKRNPSGDKTKPGKTETNTRTKITTKTYARTNTNFINTRFRIWVCVCKGEG